LGKISRRQIQSAYSVLNALAEALRKGADGEARIRDCTNKFYTLVPHDFGEGKPILIDTDELIREKVVLLDALCDIETAQSLMKQCDQDVDPVFKQYESLHTRIQPLARDSDMYHMIEEYALNGIDKKSFRTLDYEVEDIFEVEREGERERFRPWSTNSNRQLLWHGSRLLNYVGILSTGLRIAPPEAPSTGYRFGKGLYFADMSCKSAIYTWANAKSPTAIILLSEVAVGKPWETPSDKYMEKAQPGSDSTWALGMTIPDPSSTRVLEDGCIVPMGKPIHAEGRKTMCTHDEIIVYDVSQVTIRYMLRIRMKTSKSKKK